MSYEHSGTHLPEEAKAARPQFFVGHGLGSWRGRRYDKVNYGANRVGERGIPCPLADRATTTQMAKMHE